MTLHLHLRVSQANFGSIFNLCPGTLSLHVKFKFQLWLMLLMIIFCQFPTRPLLMWLVQYQLLSSYMDKHCDGTTPSLEFVLIDVESVSLIISSLHVQKASGADGLPTRFVRASPYMARLVTVLINRCIEFLFSGSWLLLHLFLNVSSVQVCLIFVQSLCYLFYPRF